MVVRDENMRKRRGGVGEFPQQLLLIPVFTGE